jgi:hypothetical protein
MILATLILGGCTNAHPVDTTQWRLYRPGMETEAPRRIKTASRRSTPVLARDTNDEVLTTGTAQSRAHRPWPRVGTPEWNEIQAEDAARERRIQEAIGNVCRGC